MGITLIYAESLKKRIEKRKEVIKTKANDDFFKRNYKISYNPLKYLQNNDVNRNNYANFVG